MPWQAAAENVAVLVGRDSERAAIDELIDAAQCGESGCLVLRGDAGMGKERLVALCKGAGGRDDRAVGDGGGGRVRA